MDANGFTQIEVTFEPKGPGLEVEVTNFLLILFSLVDQKAVKILLFGLGWVIFYQFYCVIADQNHLY